MRSTITVHKCIISNGLQCMLLCLLLLQLQTLDNKDDKVEVEEMKHLSDEDQVYVIAQHFAKVSQEYEPINNIHQMHVTLCFCLH